MHAIKGAWAGQAFALASSNDEGGKKSRIRRSKQERKAMVESFINKYQESNDGIFPSLNLTHKEVGGSFYTVREIVRDIIQENRVLAPPKVSLDEHGRFTFLQQNPLGSISVEPEIDLSVSDKLHIMAPQITDEDKILEEVSNSSEQLPHSRRDEFENDKVVNGGYALEENVDFDKPLIKNGVLTYHQDNEDERVQPEESRELSQAVTTFHMNSNFVVEKFPLRPVSRTILELDGQSGKLDETAGIHHGQSVEENSINHDKMGPVESHSGLVNEKDKEQLLDSTFDVKDIDSKATVKATNSNEGLIREDSTSVGRKSSPQNKNSLTKESNPTLDRINLETWEGTSKKPEKSPLMTMVKTFISVVVKFLTE